MTGGRVGNLQGCAIHSFIWEKQVTSFEHIIVQRGGDTVKSNI